MDLLLSAAQTWRVLLDSEYNLIYGKKKKLIVGTSSDIVFLFTDADADDGHYFPRSIFVQDIRDYTINQTPIYLGKETRITRSTGEAELIFCKPGFVEGEYSARLEQKMKRDYG